MVKRLLLLSITALLLSTAACSAVMKSEFLRSETANTDWVTIESRSLFAYVYKLQHENVSIKAGNIGFMFGKFDSFYSISFGPPLIPFIYIAWKSQPHLYPFDFQVVIESPTDITSMDLSKIRFQFSDDKLLRPSSVRAYGENGKRIEVTGLKVVAANQNIKCYLKFDNLPSDVREILVDLGTIEINNEEIKLPPLKYSRGSKYIYVPFFFDADHLSDIIYIRHHWSS